VWPKHAELTLHPLVERDLVLIDGPGRPLGRGDVRLSELEMGSYVIVARADGFEPARYPVAIFRNTDWEGELRLLPAGSIPEGFVYVPGTWAWLGGDAKATNSWPLRKVWVDSFLIQRHPVTFGEWCEFLDALPAESAPSLIPRTESLGMLCTRIAGRHEPDKLRRVLGARTLATCGECTASLPVMGISRCDIDPYLSWRDPAGSRYRLPTAAEWELAARGVDRRTYPWGWRTDSTLSWCRDASAPPPDMRPVGHAPGDRSVYGTADHGGCIHELTSTAFDMQGDLYEARGGSWESGSTQARVATRHPVSRLTRTAHVGFRLALNLPTSS
jgi:eukaryotic-like serine/threonine-protein kinase